ncbi:MAG: virulence factor [Caldilineaceae bacterium]|nr:virulence factor [Caldilineaceae bacterium]
MTAYQITYWNQIPAMVTAKSGRRDRAKVELSPRFAAAIDELAMRLGVTGTDAYLEGWRKDEWLERDGAPPDVAAAVAVELEREFPPARIRAILDDARASNS